MTCRFSFRRAVFRLVLVASFVTAVRGDPLITEFMAANTKSFADADGEYHDWIELFNPDAAAVNLEGWSLTDDAADKVRWKFPAATLPAGGYLVVFASSKNRRDPAKQLHTNFSLAAEGEYLALVKPDGTTAVSEFAPKFPAQLEDISYGTTQPTTAGEAARIGYFRTPTPGVRNGGIDTLLLLERVTFSRASGPFTGAVTLTLSGAAAGQRIRYLLAPPSANGANTAEPTATSPEYTAPIAISSSALVRASVFSADNVQRGLPTTGHFVRLATSGASRLDTFSSQLPLLVIDTHGTGQLAKESGEKSAWLYTWNRPASAGTIIIKRVFIRLFLVRRNLCERGQFSRRSFGLILMC